MGKNSWRRRVDEEDRDGGENHNPADSMWRRFIYALDYHHWQYNNVRKKLLQRLLHDGKRQDKNKTKLVRNDPGEAQRLLEEEESHQQNRQNPKKHGVNNKRSLRARIKGFILEQQSSKQSKYQRTYSIHHLEPTDGNEPDWNNPIFILPNKDKEDQNTVKEKHVNEDKDVLALLKVNEDLFLKILEDAEVQTGKFSKRKMRLTKSGSFPLYNRGNFKPLQLKDKQNEIWSGQTEKFSMAKYANDLLESLDLFADDNNRTLNPASTVDFRCKPTELAEAEGNKNDKKVASILDELKSAKSSFVHRKSCSLNESLDRYSRLYDHSFGKEEEAKLKLSRSLKVANERVIPAIPFRRIQSLSNQDSIYFLQIDQLLGSIAPFSDDPIMLAEESKENASSVDENQSEEADKSANTDEIVLVEDDYELKLDREKEEIQCSKAAASNEIVHSNLPDYQISKDLEDCAINSSDNFPTDLVSSQKLTKIEKSYKYRREPNTMQVDDDLCYVMDILECSGFTQNFFQGTWYTNEQPLNPSVLDEIEEEEEEEVVVRYHHQMLFDLVNEVLVHIYDRSFTYYPKALSSSCRIRALPTGDHVIAEVCSSIGSLLKLKPEVKQILDSIVGRDLDKDYGWMNLQVESECVGLQVEGMIFEDLLDEVLDL